MFQESYLIFDNHMHLRIQGRFMEAVKMFINSGGNSFNLVNLPYSDKPLSERYSDIYNRTIAMANKVRAETDLDVVVTLGPYPLDFFLYKEHNIDPVQAMKIGIDLAAKLVAEGKANAIGEVGRPHFPVDNNIMDLSNQIIRYAMTACRDVGCPLILHTEDLDESRYSELERMAGEVNLNLNKVVKHHASALDVCLKSQIRKSVLATRSNIRSLSKCKTGFLLETDYVDDPTTGWKVIPPDSVPRRAKMMREELADWEKIFQECFYRVPTELYGEDAFPNNFSNK